MSQNRNQKICLIGESLSHGGAEKAMALLSQFFASKGIEVHNVIVIDNVTYDYSGALLNLGKMKNDSNGLFNKSRRFSVLRKYLRDHRFDFIIDFRIRVSFLQEYIISRWLYNAPTIYTVHSAMIDLYFPKSKWQAKMIYRKAFGIAAVSGAIAEIIREKYGLEHVKILHNPVDIAAIRQSMEAFIPEEENYILAAGRMKDNVKQFDKLIETYAKTSLPGKGIKLVILGDGQQRAALQKQVEDSNLVQSVVLKGRVDNPFPYMKNARFFVLSSKSEGLPTVILESFAAGVPVVSFDCVSGPAEMIVDRQNGLLVEDQNFEKLAEAMELFAANETLYENCRSQSVQGAKNFSLENIGEQWLEFLKNTVS